MTFNEFKLHPRLLRSIADRGYVEPTDVQVRTLAVTLAGRDAAVQSQTGTGKTAAFLITAFERLLQDREGGKTLIVVPTRELAVQIDGEADLLNTHLGFTIGCFYGGVGYERQRAALKKGVDILVGTPGRLLDLADSGRLDLSRIRILVIDEADRLFDMGFLPDLRKILRKCPPPHARQGMLFSATLNRLARQVASTYMNKPTTIELTPDHVTVETTAQELYKVASMGKAGLLLGILKTEAPKNALIFTNTKHEAERLARKIARCGLPCRHLTGDLPQDQRLRIMDDFSSGRFPYLVATDLAARGIHIDNLEMVINYDLPLEAEGYVHRIGRTGRAGAAGRAISFADEKLRTKVWDIERYIGMQIPVKTASAEVISEGLNLEYSAPAPSEREGDGRSGRYGRERGHDRGQDRDRGRSSRRRRGNGGRNGRRSARPQTSPSPA